MENAIDRSVLNLVLDEVGPEVAPVILETFIEELGNQTGVLGTAAASADHQGMRDAAHRLKSSAASFGALALSETAGTIEHAVRNGEPDQAIATLDRFRELASASLTELKALQA